MRAAEVSAWQTPGACQRFSNSESKLQSAEQHRGDEATLCPSTFEPSARRERWGFGAK